jgi:hypothetical protein
LAKENPILKVNPPILSEFESKFVKMDFVASLSSLGVNGGGMFSGGFRNSVTVYR